MYLPGFAHAKMEWDSWKAFHVTHLHSAFVQFDTNEFVVCDRRWPPEQRHIYRDLHLQIVATNDEDCPRLYVPGAKAPIPKSHLNHKGQQTLLLDLDHKVAVSLGRHFNDASLPPGSTIPGRFRYINSRTTRAYFPGNSHGVSVYYTGPGSKPVSAASIIRLFPQPLTAAQRVHLDELKNACMVWLGMQATSTQEELKKAYRTTPAPPAGEFCDVSFAVLTTEHRTAIALRLGFDMIAKEEYPWLTFDTDFVSPHPNNEENEDL